MLVISRRVGEAIKIGENISIKILEMGKNQIKIGIDAPKDIKIIRSELIDEIKKENKKANQKISIDAIKKFDKVLHEN